MKKIFLSLFAIAISCLTAWAVPADPTPFKYTQPDGTVITLQLHGDEFFHWITDASGQIVKKDADGFYRPSNESLQTLSVQAMDNRSQRLDSWSSYDNAPETNFGDRKVLCIIANFSDVSFSIDNPNEHFSNMLNQAGYSAYGAVGSVRDYYVENSHNKYRPQFDVYGPVTLSNTSAHYDSYNTGVVDAILEAYDLLEAAGTPIPIEDYDTNNDDRIDMVLFYYPGYNEAEGGGTNTIWPHQWSGNFGKFGTSGKYLVRYFCTSELKGNTSTNPDKIPASIGTTCHEFGHSLGLPDFYDTDYEKSGGDNDTTGPYDLMASGSYNDSGRRPPYLSAVERNMLGWMPTSALVGLASKGNYSLEPVQNDKAFQFSSTVPGEYFVLEYRNGTGWDAALPATGLLVYHIDKSDRVVPGSSYTAAELWEDNSINAYGGHPCYYLVSTVESATTWSQCIFPGSSDITQYAPTGWDGDSVPLFFTQIAHDGSAAASFHLEVLTSRQVVGTVTDTDGNPLEGVQVSLTQSAVPFAAAPSLLDGSLFTTTDADGKYSFDLEDDATNDQILMAQKEGFVSLSINLSISSLLTQENLTLLQIGEGLPADLQKYDMSYGMTSWGWGTDDPMAVSLHYSAEELSDANVVGGMLKNVTFLSRANNGETVYLIVDIPGVVSFRKDVTSQYEYNTFVTIDISQENIVIPEGKELFIGYGLSPSTTSHPWATTGNTGTNRGGFFYSFSYLDDNTTWYNAFDNDDEGYNLLISATVKTNVDIEFSALGVSYIKLVEYVPSVQVAAGKSLRSITWTLDGESVAEPVDITTLAAGSHTYMARLLYYDGTAERVYYDFER